MSIRSLLPGFSAIYKHDIYGVCEGLAEGVQFNGSTSLGLLVLQIPSSGKHQSNITHTQSRLSLWWLRPDCIHSQPRSICSPPAWNWVASGMPRLRSQLPYQPTCISMRPSIFVNRGELALARPLDPCTTLLSSYGASPHLCYQNHSHLSFIHSQTNFHGHTPAPVLACYSWIHISNFHFHVVLS